MPEATSRAPKAKAALQGRSLSDYLLSELQQLASRPSREVLPVPLDRLLAVAAPDCALLA